MIVSRTITGTEPVTITEAKLWLKVDFTTDDALITELISHCRELIEQYTGRSLVASTVIVEVESPNVNEVLTLPLPVHVSVDAVTLDAVASTEYEERGTSVKKLELTGTGIYRITYKTGALIDPTLKTMVKKLVAHHYENRNADLELPRDLYKHLLSYTI